MRTVATVVINGTEPIKYGLVSSTDGTGGPALFIGNDVTLVLCSSQSLEDLIRELEKLKSSKIILPSRVKLSEKSTLQSYRT